MKKLACVLSATALLTGCATVDKVAIDANVATTMQGKSLVRTTRATKPDFSAMTAGKGAFALVGAFAAISAGNDLIKQNDVPVPADAIGQALGEQLRGARGMQLAAAPMLVTSNETEQIAAAANGKADYVLDVQTTGWMFIYFPTQWGRYKVIHSAQARVIDVANKKVVAQGVCSRNPEYTEAAPTYDELVNNQAAGLKRELATAGADCVSSLKRDILAL